MGKVREAVPQEGGMRFVVELGAMADGLKPGQSVAVNGVCLTVVEPQGSLCSFDVITETLRKTNLGRLAVGSKVNIERSLRANDRIEGHLVQGHVHGVATLTKRVENEKDFILTFTPAAELMVYLPLLGCVAVNGVSLTIAAITPDSFSVALIPTTLELTNLGDLEEGDDVNIETDIVARQIVHWLSQQKT